jgi:hypothetical protein
LALLGLFLVLGGWFAILWFGSDAHPVSFAQADNRFRHSGNGKAGYSVPGRPAVGVYSYVGTGAGTLTIPPKTQHDGPTIPGTVTYSAGGCWTLRLDYSNDHWELATYCPHHHDLLEVGRGGWYQWNLVATSVSDAAAYLCRPAEIAVPGPALRRHPVHFSCIGHNSPLKIGPVTMAGTVRFLRTGTVHVGAQKVPAVQMEEEATFSGGQTGTDVERTWYSQATGLPLESTWSTDVTTPTPIGSSTLHSSASFHLTSLTPHG